MKLVFKAVLIADGQDGFDPTLASVTALLESFGLSVASPASLENPFVIDLDQSRKKDS